MGARYMPVREIIDTSQLIEASTTEWEAPEFWGSLVPLAYWSAGRQRMLVPDVARNRVSGWKITSVCIAVTSALSP